MVGSMAKQVKTWRTVRHQFPLACFPAILQVTMTLCFPGTSKNLLKIPTIHLLSKEEGLGSSLIELL